MIVALRWILEVKTDEHSDVRSIRQGLLLRVIIERRVLILRNCSLRMSLANAPNQYWTVYQRGVKTAYLKGNLNDVDYVSQPEGFVVRDRPTHVYCLLKGPLWPLAGA